MIFSRGRLGTALHEGWEILHLSPRKPLGKSVLFLCDLRDTSARRTRTPIDTLQRLISTNNMLSLISTLVARSDGPRNAKLAVDPLVIYERMFFSFGWSRGLTGFRERPSPNEKEERASIEMPVKEKSIRSRLRKVMRARACLSIRWFVGAVPNRSPLIVAIRTRLLLLRQRWRQRRNRWMPGPG